MLNCRRPGAAVKGYEGAERQAKEWLFLNYDPRIKESQLDDPVGANQVGF
jgi:hypothetical protein